MSDCVCDSLIDYANEMAGNWLKFDSFCWYDKPVNPEKWCIVYTTHRDSGIMSKSNESVIRAALEPFNGRTVHEESHNHWAVGHVDGFAIRVFRKNSKITRAFRVLCELQFRLEDYPLLDEDDYYRREYDATIENLTSEGYDSDLFDAPEEWEYEVYSWLCENNQRAIENRDDSGGYATRAEIHEAMDALGWRILWRVDYIDVGQTTEWFDDEYYALERANELTSLGFHPTVKPETKCAE